MPSLPDFTNGEDPLPATKYLRETVGEGMTAKVCILDENTVLKYPQLGCKECLIKDRLCMCLDAEAYEEHRMNAIAVEQSILTHIGRHPGIVELLYCCAEGSCFKRAANGSLHDYVKKIGWSNLSMSRKLRWAIQLAEDLEVVHDKGVIHCDVQPHNFLVDAEDNILICDFSGSYFEAGDLDGRGRESVGYCKPGHTESSVPCVATDLFALGSILYWLMAGENPYQSLGTEEVTLKFNKGEFPETEGVPGGEIIAKCWHGQFESASEVRLSLQWLQRRVPWSLETDIPPFSLGI